MSTDLKDYVDIKRLLRWLDVDPSFDPSWLSWVFKRPYSFCPSMSAAVGVIGGLDFNRAIVDSEDLGKELTRDAVYRGKGIDERVTAEQIRFAAGLKKDGGKLRPVRLDKALLTAYAVNKALEASKKPSSIYTIYLSAYNIHGLAKVFAAADAEKKARIRETLVKSTSQSNGFVGEFLKGNKASLDFTISAYEILASEGDIRDSLPGSIAEAIETPSQKFTTAALGEDFSKTRIGVLPAPFKRPG